MMGSLELSPEEVALLREVLENVISDLRMEISNTDSSSFKEKLHTRKDTLNAILAKLEALG